MAATSLSCTIAAGSKGARHFGIPYWFAGPFFFALSHRRLSHIGRGPETGLWEVQDSSADPPVKCPLDFLSVPVVCRR